MTRAVQDDLLADDCCQSAQQLLTPGNVAAYLAAADRGDLRVVPRTSTRQSGHSARIRRTVLAVLAATAGVPVRLPALPPAPALRDTPTARQRADLFRWVASDSSGPYARPASRRAMIRLAALVGVVLDTGSRTGELVAITLDDLSDDLDQVVVRRRPQRGYGQRTDLIALSDPTRAALKKWINIRAGLVDRLSGTPPRALWVTVAGGGPCGSRPPGLPVGHDILARQYAATVGRLNYAQSGAPGWRPLPVSIEQLRRSSKPIAVAGACRSSTTEDMPATAA
ncbi:hypothetical protein AB0G95_21790 [Streptomyces virginiae]|uniref:hypothetical protein n=1 Tax=Streptomyces virginiae TaxID=1961 RepID=UPI00342D2880